MWWQYIEEEQKEEEEAEEEEEEEEEDEEEEEQEEKEKQRQLPEFSGIYPFFLLGPEFGTGDPKGGLRRDLLVGGGGGPPPPKIDMGSKPSVRMQG